MIHNPGIIRICTIIVPANEHRYIEIIFLQNGLVLLLYICFLFYFLIYLTFIFYKLEDGNTFGQNMQEFTVSVK